MCGHLPSFRTIDTPHQRVHALGKEAVATSSKGDKVKAADLVRQMDDASREVIAFLDKIKTECGKNGSSY